MDQKYSIDDLRNVFPRAQLVGAKAPDRDQSEAFVQVDFYDNLVTVVTQSPTFSEKSYRALPLSSQIAPPFAFLFPQTQPTVDHAVAIQGGFAIFLSDEVNQMLGLERFRSPHNKLQPCIVCLATGVYEHSIDGRRMFLRRYNESTHLVAHVFWQEGYAPQQAGTNSVFGKANHALEFYRVCPTNNYCGSDFWLTELHPHTAFYQMLEQAAHQVDQWIQKYDTSVATRSVLYRHVKQKFIDSGIVGEVADLSEDGWSIKFDEEAIVLSCTDNNHHLTMVSLEYDIANIDLIHGLIAAYQAGEFRILEVLGLDGLF